MSERRNLRRALAREDLQLHYQPIVDPTSGRVVSVEALIRGRENDRRDWNPSEVTEKAELGDDIFDLDRWMIEQGCRDASQWQKSGLDHVALNLNVSTREFQNRNFVKTLDRIITTTGLDPYQVILEITETASIHEPEHAEEVVSHLQDRGHRIWLDDFGTGHSSLAWLKWFPVDGVKIPSLFTSDVMNDERCQTIVSGIISLARGLDFLVVAEGVENREQLDILVEQGVNLVQGFLFYKPLAAEELARTIAAGKENQ